MLRRSVMLADGSSDAAMLPISAVLFIFWETLAEDYDEAADWAFQTDLTPFRGLYYPDSSIRTSLGCLGRLFEETLKILHAHRKGESPLMAIISVRAHVQHFDVQALCAHTVLYLAQQAAIHPHPRRLGHGVTTVNDSNYDTMEQLRRSILNFCDEAAHTVDR